MQNSIHTSGSIGPPNPIPAIGLALVFGFPILAFGDEITATIRDWPHETADIVTGFMEPGIIGRVEPDGTVRIPLAPDYTQNMIKSMETQNFGDSEWTASMCAAGEVWGCDTGDLDVQNDDRYALNLATMGTFVIGNMEEDVGYGMLMVTNSREFAEGYDPFGGSALSGWYIDWVHAETDISILGDCEEFPLTLPEGELQAVTSYRIKLTPGWNLLKYEIEEVHEDESGRIWPKKSSYRTLDTLPEDAEFVFVSDK